MEGTVSKAQVPRGGPKVAGRAIALRKALWQTSPHLKHKVMLKECEASNHSNNKAPDKLNSWLDWFSAST